MFNEGLYYEHAIAGQLRMEKLSDEPAPKKAGQRRGARSQIVAYFDGNTKVCVVHQYWHRHSGTVGGSGKKRPDPRMIYENGTIFQLDKTLP